MVRIPDFILEHMVKCKKKIVELEKSLLNNHDESEIGNIKWAIAQENKQYGSYRKTGLDVARNFPDHPMMVEYCELDHHEVMNVDKTSKREEGEANWILNTDDCSNTRLRGNDTANTESRILDVDEQKETINQRNIKVEARLSLFEELLGEIKKEREKLCKNKMKEKSKWVKLIHKPLFTMYLTNSLSECHML